MKKVDPSKAKESQNKRLICELFPLIPAATINHFIHHHPELDEAELVAHFLEIKEPTGKAPNLAAEGIIARARVLQRQRKKEEEKMQILLNKGKELRLKITKLDTDKSFIKFSDITLDTINQRRLMKKRSKLVSEDYLTKVAFYVANELMLGNESMDNKDWSEYLNTHTEKLIEPRFTSGFLMKTGDPLASISELVTHEPQWKSIVFSSSRYCGIGVSISKLGAVFLTMIVADLE